MSDSVPQNIPQKQCVKCNREFPATSAYFYASKRGKYGMRTECKLCSQARDARRRPRRIEDTTKRQCGTCKHVFPATIEYFHVDKKGKHGISARCKMCAKKATRQYYQSHKEEVLAYVKEYSQAHKEEINAYQKTYGQSHRAEINAGVRRFNQRNPEQRQANTRNRRARIRGNGGTHTAQDIRNQYERQKGRCYYAACGHVKLGKTYHVDHVVPVSKGGSNGPENLVIACRACNQSKWSKLPHEWPQGGRLL